MMERITHECLQGSAEWLDLRAMYFTASEASAALGESKYQKRADLIKQKATGIVHDVDAGKQRLFDAGHAAEAAARPIVEEQLGTELFPVTMSAEVEGLPLLASLDGISMFGNMIWENKLLNESLKADVLRGELSNHYALQIEQQLLVSGAEVCYFTTSDGTPEGTFGLHYESNPELRAKLIAGWKQFALDVAAYQPEAVKPEVTGTAPDQLPALRIEVTGMVTASNLEQFKTAALSVFRGINTSLQTDQDFADAEKAVKFCKDAEEKLEAAKEQALSQTESIDALFKTIDQIKDEARTVRLKLDKLVKAEKENRKAEIAAKASAEFSDHLQSLFKRTGVTIPVTGNIGAAMAGLKSLDSMRDKVSVALANAKVEANAIADRIDANRKTVDDMSLFPDFAQVAAKMPEDFAALMAMRIGQRQARLDAEREKIRAEEEAKAQATARREAQEAAAKAESERIAALPPVVEVKTNHIEQPRAMVDHIPDATKLIATGKTIKLGEICARLGFTISADFLESLGFKATVEKNARLYPEASFNAICRALQRHINDVATGTVRLAA